LNTAWPFTVSVVFPICSLRNTTNFFPSSIVKIEPICISGKWTLPLNTLMRNVLANTMSKINRTANIDNRIALFFLTLLNPLVW
jgi:hypothetical protein